MKRIVALLCGCLLLTGCTFGDPDYYTLFIFQGEGDSWRAELEYVADHEGDHPQDQLLMTYIGEETEGEAEISIVDTDIREHINFQPHAETVQVLESSKLKELIIAKTDQDDRITEEIELIVIWGGNEETIALSYHTTVKEDEGITWFDGLFD
ncbi:hypothetical protein KP77_12010 [Jeotgalibacillus alimentarius]|uniref:Lipoprotein n=1 Tax=Jeotgalibacillus alimentarius TaxID=135826 RepID=A0A0C2SCJ8_9BACL|nr:hypothetical protein [Jeotgalibacillus alimentarius]KIL51689.1 hypothetical protein KP77_12010 [Jeotgalibacillus alimentarius]